MAMNKSASPAEGQHAHVSDDQHPSPCLGSLASHHLTHPLPACPNWPNIKANKADKIAAALLGMPLPSALQRAGLACSINYPAEPRLRILLLRAAELLDLDLRVRGAVILPLEKNDPNPNIGNLPPADATFADLMAAGTPQRLDYSSVRQELVRVWQKPTCAHIEQTCARIWRPSKKMRQLLLREAGDEGGAADAAGVKRLALYLRCFPEGNPVAATTTTTAAAATATTTATAASGEPGAGKEVLLPRLVTFVLRDETPRHSEDSKPDAKGHTRRAVIRYLEPGQRDRQGDVSLTDALTAAFVCEKGMAPAVEERYEAGWDHQRRRFVGRFAEEDEDDDNRNGNSEEASKEKPYTRTLLVFAASVCLDEGWNARGGVCVVTKDTIHFHEERVLNSLLEIDKRVEADFEKASQADLKKLKLCVNAFDKPNRGHNRNLYRGVQGDDMPDEAVGACPLLGGVYAFPLERRGAVVDADKFGLVKSRYRPWWIGVDDDKRNVGLKKLRDHATWAIKLAEQMEGEKAGEDADDTGGHEHNEQDGTNLAGTMRNVSLDDGPDDNNTVPAPAPATNPNPKARPVPIPIETARATIKVFKDAEINTSHLDSHLPSQAAGAESADLNNITAEPNNKPPPKPTQLTPRYPATPNRAAARALLAAVQIHPFDLSHCTRLVIATDSEHAIEMATSRLANMLLDSSAPPLRTARTKQPVEDADLWWTFAGAVKDLAYQGVEVAILKCGAKGGVVIPCEMPFSGKKTSTGAGDDDGNEGSGNLIFGMPQAFDAARQAALNAIKLDVRALIGGERREEGAVDRVVALHV